MLLQLVENCVANVGEKWYAFTTDKLMCDLSRHHVCAVMYALTGILVHLQKSRCTHFFRTFVIEYNLNVAVTREKFYFILSELLLIPIWKTVNKLSCFRFLGNCYQMKNTLLRSCHQLLLENMLMFNFLLDTKHMRVSFIIFYQCCSWRVISAYYWHQNVCHCWPRLKHRLL